MNVLCSRLMIFSTILLTILLAVIHSFTESFEMLLACWLLSGPASDLEGGYDTWPLLMKRSKQIFYLASRLGEMSLQEDS